MGHYTESMDCKVGSPNSPSLPPPPRSPRCCPSHYLSADMMTIISLTKRELSQEENIVQTRLRSWPDDVPKLSRCPVFAG